MSQTHYTYCRNCNAQCGLKVEVEDNKVLSVAGDREHPITLGYFCVKGRTSMDYQNGDDRRTSARKGRGADQTDVPVEQVLDEIGERLAAIVERYGSHSIALYYGTGANFNALAHSALKAGMHMLGSPYIFSSMTLDQSAKWVAMGRMGFFAAGQHSLADADVAVLVGMNPAVSHAGGAVVLPQNPARTLRDAKARGAKIIVVDPRLTETARQADLHLQIRPGEDAALFAGMIHIVLQRGWENREFCERFVGSMQELRAAVADFTPDYVAQRTGVARESIETAAQMFSHARRPTAGTGTGPNMAAQSNLSEHMVRALNAICGGYRRAGDVVRNPGFLVGPRTFVEKVVPPNRSWEQGPKLRTRDIGALFGEYPTALIPDEIIGRGEERIRALIVVGGNPMMALADPGKTFAAFERLDLLVTLDSRRTETTDRSDYVVPTTLPYERLDITAMFDHYNPVAYASVATPFITPPAGVIHDWEFFWELARRMGRPLELKRPMFGAAHEQIPGPSLALDMTVRPTTESLIRWVASSFGAANYDELLNSPRGVVREDLATTVQPAGEDDGVRLDAMPADVAAELAAVKTGEPGAEFKYRLTVRRLLMAMNSAYRNAAKTRERHPVNPAFMNPLDMAEEGIEAAGAIKISSEHGEIVAYAQPEPGVRRGVISMTHQWGAADPSADPDGRTGAFTGRLASLDHHLQTINFMPLQSAIPVNVKPCARS